MVYAESWLATRGGVLSRSRNVRARGLDNVIKLRRVRGAATALLFTSSLARRGYRSSSLAPTLLRRPDGYKVGKWSPPPELIPDASEAPQLYNDATGQLRSSARAHIGTLRIEVLQCESLPKMMVGIIDPYALVVFEGYAARTSTVRNDRTPCWGAEAPRAFQFPVACPYSTVDVALNDEDEGLLPDDALGRVVIDLSQIRGRTVYDCWFDLQYGIARTKGKRGAVRLRYSVEWFSDR